MIGVNCVLLFTLNAFLLSYLVQVVKCVECLQEYKRTSKETSIAFQYSSHENSDLFYTQTRHNDFFSYYKLFQEKLEKKLPKKHTYTLSEYVESAHTP